MTAKTGIGRRTSDLKSRFLASLGMTTGRVTRKQIPRFARNDKGGLGLRRGTGEGRMAWSDLRLVQQFGPHLDEWLGEDTQVRDILITTLLKIRPKRGWVQYLRLNRAQSEYSRKATKRNIVLKARQVGITT